MESETILKWGGIGLDPLRRVALGEPHRTRYQRNKEGHGHEGRHLGRQTLEHART